MESEVDTRRTPRSTRDREEFTAPECFLDGVPCRRVLAGIDATGSPEYETVAIDIPAAVPSLYWREGC